MFNRMCSFCVFAVCFDFCVRDGCLCLFCVCLFCFVSVRKVFALYCVVGVFVFCACLCALYFFGVLLLSCVCAFCLFGVCMFWGQKTVCCLLLLVCVVCVVCVFCWAESLLLGVAVLFV